MKTVFLIIMAFSQTGFTHMLTQEDMGFTNAGADRPKREEALTCAQELEQTKARSNELGEKLKASKYICIAICAGGDFLIGGFSTLVHVWGEDQETAFGKLEDVCKKKMERDFHMKNSWIAPFSRTRTIPQNHCFMKD